MKRVIPILLLGGLAFGGVQWYQGQHPVTASLAYGPKEQTGEAWRAEARELKAADKRAGSAKYDGPDEFMRFFMDIRTPADAQSPEYPAGYAMQELQKMRRFQARGAQSPINAVWTERGPNNVAGRARALVVDPDDNTHSTWYVGSAGGGIWKTTDMGNTWSNLTPDFPNLATTVLAMAESNTNVIYAGTGEGFFNGDAIRGDGIFKSTDKGNTWTQLASTAGNSNFYYVNRMVVDPADENIVVAATNVGIYRSTDGGTSWTTVAEPSGRVQDLDADPTNFNRQYASVNGLGVLRSDDGGITWDNASSGLATIGARRYEMAISPVNTSKIFLSVEVSGANDVVYYTTDGADTWNLFGSVDNQGYEYLGGQGWYDNTIVADLYNEDKAYLAGVEIFSIDVTNGLVNSDPVVYNAQVNNLDFLTFVNFGGSFLNGGLSVNAPGTGDAIDLVAEDFVSVEVRFGPGLTQKAHRFTIPANGGTNGDGGAGVPASAYTYQDYVDVPFQVWDVTNNRQLSISFRDQEADGTYDLEAADPNDDSRSREYIFINATEYNAAGADASISSQGHTYKQMYFLWPRLAPGTAWDPNNSPEGTIQIDFGSQQVAEGVVAVHADPYGRYNSLNNGVHPDHHNLFVVPTNEANEEFLLINLNDGGGSLSTNGLGVITQWGTTMRTTQFYGADKSPVEDRYLGGTQDNGTWMSPAGEVASANTNYLFGIGGDGFEVVWNYGDPDQAIGGSQYNGLSRTTNGGRTWGGATTGMQDVGSGNAPFITKFGNAKSNPDYLFVVGAQGVWKSTDFGASWNLRALSDGWFVASSSQVEVSLADPSVVWVGSAMSGTGDVFVSTDYGDTFTAVPDYDGAVLGSLSGIDTHPTDRNTAYATFSFFGRPHVLRTTDMGQTWEDITQMNPDTNESENGFPNVATYCVLVMPHNPDVIWVGTEIGIVESADGGATWQLADVGLPSVAVWQMKIVDDQVVVATHGRGIWTATIDELPEMGVIPNILSGFLDGSGDLNLNVELGSRFDSSSVYLDENLLFNLGGSQAGNGVISGTYAGGEGIFEATMIGYLDGKEYRSLPRQVNLKVVEPLRVYENSFDANSEADFYGEGFTISQEVGFENEGFAIHSPHPYPQNTELTYQLAWPIIINDSASYMSYKDVAIVEIGEDGAAFGQVNFYDYVVVEGTTDNGLTWTPVAPGYDANFNASWRNFYDNNNAGRDGLYREHIINLHETFNAGDTVLFRFRLFSDPLTVSWGWAVDDLNIQGDIEVVTGLGDVKPDLSLSAYPNPTSGPLSVSYELAKGGQVAVSIYGLNGNRYWHSDQGFQSQGRHQASIPAHTLAPGSYILVVNNQFGNNSIKIIIE